MIGAPMRLRDAQYRAFDSVFVLSGVADLLVEGLEGGFVALLGSPAGAPLRRSWPNGRILRVAAARRLAPTAIRQVPPQATASELVAVVRRAGYDRLPISITVSGDRLAVAFSHAVADGGGMVALLQALVASALGLPMAEPAGRATRLALPRALAAAGPRAVLAGRRAHPGFAAPPVFAPTPSAAQAALVDARLLELRIDATRLERIRRAKHGAGAGRATITTRVASLVLAALAASHHLQEDLRVHVPVDLRHHVHGRVDGNFISTAALGGLRSTTWTPKEIGGRVSAMGGVPGLVALAEGAMWAVIARVRHAPPWREWAVTVSVLTSDELPDATWSDPGTGSVGCASIGPWPSPLFVLVWFSGDDAFLSVWDEARAIDLRLFEAELDAELLRRERPMPPLRDARVEDPESGDDRVPATA